jgi:hypothetical protein
MSHVTLINHTNEVVRLAIFKQPVRMATLGNIAWRIAEPPPGGQQVIEIPAEFSTFARYSTDPERPSELSAETAHVAFAETTAHFSIDSVSSQDRHAGGAVMTQRFTDLVLDEVRVVNNYGLGCLVAICKDGDPLYAPQVVWPGGLLMEDVRGSMYVSVVAQFTSKGSRLIDEEITQTQTELREGGTVTVTGSMWTGYALTVS